MTHQRGGQHGDVRSDQQQPNDVLGQVRATGRGERHGQLAPQDAHPTQPQLQLVAMAQADRRVKIECVQVKVRL